MINMKKIILVISLMCPLFAFAQQTNNDKAKDILQKAINNISINYDMSDYYANVKCVRVRNCQNKLESLLSNESIYRIKGRKRKKMKQLAYNQQTNDLQYKRRAYNSFDYPDIVKYFSNKQAYKCIDTINYYSIQANEGQYIITVRQNNPKLHLSKTKVGLPVIYKYYINTNDLAITKVELSNDTVAMSDFKNMLGSNNIKYDSSHYIYTYTKNGSKYYLTSFYQNNYWTENHTNESGFSKRNRKILTGFNHDNIEVINEEILYTVENRYKEKPKELLKKKNNIEIKSIEELLQKTDFNILIGK